MSTWSIVMIHSFVISTYLNMSQKQKYSSFVSAPRLQRQLMTTPPPPQQQLHRQQQLQQIRPQPPSRIQPQQPKILRQRLSRRQLQRPPTQRRQLARLQRLRAPPLAATPSTVGASSAGSSWPSACQPSATSHSDITKFAQAKPEPELLTTGSKQEQKSAKNLIFSPPKKCTRRGH